MLNKNNYEENTTVVQWKDVQNNRKNLSKSYYLIEPHFSYLKKKCG